MTPEEKFLRSWQKMSALGKQKYSLYFGVGWGVVTAIISELCSAFLFNDPKGFSWPQLIFRMIFMSIVGYFFTRYNWSANEKRFLQIEKNKNTETKTENLL
jgi:hypothetical protein